MRVDLVDPPAYSPPYDHALAAALARLGAEVRLVTSAFAYGDPPAPDGYARDEYFYRHALGPAGSRLRALSKRTEHPLDMLRYRRAADRPDPDRAATDPAVARRAVDHTAPDVVHFEWLTVPRLDLRLLPRRPTVLTIHDPLIRAQPSRPALPASAFARVDAIVVHSDYAKRCVVAQHGLEPDRIHVIRHGALRAGEAFYVPSTQNASRVQDSLPAELRDGGAPVVLSYGLIRPYKGIETLLEAWRGIDDAQLWVVGRPMMDLAPHMATAPSGVQIVPRFVTPQQERALFERADLVVLPYERSERFGFSGVLATALGHGKAIVLSDVGGLAELASDPAAPAAQLVPPGDPEALHATLVQLLGDEHERARLAAAAAEAASGPYSWEAAARATLTLYARIASR